MISFLDIFDDFAKGFTTGEGIGGAIAKGLRSMFYAINELIYKIANFLYNLFEILCNARLLDSEELSAITQRVGVILGIIMLFIVMFNMIQMILDPSKVEGKDGASSVVKKCIIVIIMLGTSGFVFDGLYYFQRYVIENQILFKLVLPTSDTEIDTDSFGGVLIARTFTNFYTVKDEAYSLEDNIGNQCQNYNNLLMLEIIEDTNFDSGLACLNASVNVEDSVAGERGEFVMEYNYILQLLVGGFLVYILLSYVFKVGIRVIQLTVLEIISPMAIISYLSPKDSKMFQSWTSLYITTYIDVFIRLLIIYFMIFLSSTLLDSFNIVDPNSTFWMSLGTRGQEYRGWIIIIMVIALLSFAKKAPDLIKELFPAGKGGLGFGASMKDIVGLKPMLGIGAGVGAAVGVSALTRVPEVLKNGKSTFDNTKNAKGFIGKSKALGQGLFKTGASAISGVGGIATAGFRGGIAGYKSKSIIQAMKDSQQAQAKRNAQRLQDNANGQNIIDKMSGSYHQMTGTPDSYEVSEAIYSAYKDVQDDINNDDSVMAQKQAMNDAYSEFIRNGGNTTIEQWKANEGKRFDEAISKTRADAYKNKMEKDGVFQEKVARLNRKAGQNYNKGTEYTDIKNSADIAKTKYEKIRERKKK